MQRGCTFALCTKTGNLNLLGPQGHVSICHWDCIALVPLNSTKVEGPIKGGTFSSWLSKVWVLQPAEFSKWRQRQRKCSNRNSLLWNRWSKAVKNLSKPSDQISVKMNSLDFRPDSATAENGSITWFSSLTWFACCLSHNAVPFSGNHFCHGLKLSPHSTDWSGSFLGFESLSTGLRN